MANSRYEYVRSFERENLLLQETHLLIRVDGRGFHKFSAEYEFSKPNDIKALEVMNCAAKAVMENISDVVLAYGDSDEYLFLLRKDCQLFDRRELKLVLTFALTISAYYQYYWNEIMPDRKLKPGRLPTFDARVVVYPNSKTVKDYFAWRQVDCHINNLYNTTFWTLVEKGGLTPKEAENSLIGTLSADKNEILFTKFGINYNNEPLIFKKGTTMVRRNPNLRKDTDLSNRQKQREQKKLKDAPIEVLHTDIIKDVFWEDKQWIFD